LPSIVYDQRPIWDDLRVSFLPTKNTGHLYFALIVNVLALRKKKRNSEIRKKNTRVFNLDNSPHTYFMGCGVSSSSACLSTRAIDSNPRAESAAAVPSHAEGAETLAVSSEWLEVTRGDDDLQESILPPDPSAPLSDPPLSALGFHAESVPLGQDLPKEARHVECSLPSSELHLSFDAAFHLPAVDVRDRPPSSDGRLSKTAAPTPDFSRRVSEIVRQGLATFCPTAERPSLRSDESSTSSNRSLKPMRRERGDAATPAQTLPQAELRSDARIDSLDSRLVELGSAILKTVFQ
jgi:hypothetical protein